MLSIKHMLIGAIAALVLYCVSVGATSVCKSGAISSANQGACSHHGGVALWLPFRRQG